MFERLKTRIGQDLGLKLDSFRRTYAGKHMKGSGAFVWIALDSKNNHIYGSSESATDLVNRTEKLSIVEDLNGGQVQYEIT